MNEGIWETKIPIVFPTSAVTGFFLGSRCSTDRLWACYQGCWASLGGLPPAEDLEQWLLRCLFEERWWQAGLWSPRPSTLAGRCLPHGLRTGWCLALPRLPPRGLAPGSGRCQRHALAATSSAGQLQTAEERQDWQAKEGVDGGVEG